LRLGHRLRAARTSRALTWLHCRSETEPGTGYWSKTFIGWVAYHEAFPLIRHDVTGWAPIEDQVAARAVPLEKPRRPGDPAIVVGEAKAPCRPAAPVPHRVRKPTLVVGR
jgi:hypothetical protein